MGKAVKLMLAALAVGLGAAISGCASMSESQLDSLDYGPPITQYDAQAVASSFLKNYLADPYSAVVDFGAVQKGYVREPFLNGGTLHYGYVLDANINAKNKLGAYTGITPYKFVFRNGRLDSVLEEKPGNYWAPAI